MDCSLHLARFVEQHRRIFVLTGAGCSTASGIPDYRDEQGAWKRKAPITYQELTRSERVRQRFWARSLVGFRRISRAEPNDTHHALTALEQQGRISLLVTQNVDGLHHASGSQNVVDLHGRLDEIECIACRASTPRAVHQERLERLNPAFVALSGSVAPDGDFDLEDAKYEEFQVPVCEACGGTLKPKVVFFGENVPAERVQRAYAALESSDAVLVVGSSLMVFSGYRFAVRAHKTGLPLAIVNRGRTRADDMAHLKIDDDAGAVLRDTVKHLRRPGAPERLAGA